MLASNSLVFPSVLKNRASEISQRLDRIKRCISEISGQHFATGASDVLWAVLCDGLGPFTFRRHCRISGCQVDFACVRERLAIRVDGDGRASYEARSTVILAECGYRVLRFWSDEILQRTGDVLAEILCHIEMRRGRASYVREAK